MSDTREDGSIQATRSLSTVVRDIDSALKLGGFETSIAQNELATLSDKINQLVDLLGDYDQQPGVEDLISLAKAKREAFYEQVNIASKRKSSPSPPGTPVVVRTESSEARKRIHVEVCYLMAIP